MEVFGEQLKDKTALIELDNTSAMATYGNLYSKAEDMQELIRRILEITSRFNITLRVCHTPGAMLDRPDQTSRGDLPEEPRLRLTREVFGELS